MYGKRTRPSVALVISMIALFVALGGTAGAVVSAAVPLAKRALTADNAKKLSGQSAAQILSQAAQTPGPASSAGGLVTVKTAPWSLAPGGESDFQASCDAGQKAIAGGWEDPGGWSHSWDSRPSADGSGWRTFVTTSSNASGAQSGNVYAICLK
jgi:hypothetical protein